MISKKLNALMLPVSKEQIVTYVPQHNTLPSQLMKKLSHVVMFGSAHTDHLKGNIVIQASKEDLEKSLSFTTILVIS